MEACLNNSFFANQFGYPFIDFVTKAMLCLHKNEQNPLFFYEVTPRFFVTYHSN